MITQINYFFTNNTSLLLGILTLIFLLYIAFSFIIKRTQKSQERCPSRESGNPLQIDSRFRENDTAEPKSTILTSHDIRAIAGDDVLITQLDLARAYIELGKKKLAKQILEHVLRNGNSAHKQAAEQLIAHL
jgi:FimV-like protein